MAAPVSARFKALVGGDSYQLVSRVEVLNATGAVLLDSDNPTTPLTVVGGSIQVDGSAAFQRSISDLTIADPTGAWVPATTTSYFSPVASNQLRLSVGLLVDGVKEYVQQGIFPLEDADTEDAPQGITIKLSAYDRGMRYSRARRINPKTFDASANTTIVAAITQLLQDAVSGSVLYGENPTYLTPSQVIDTAADPWDAARELAASMGHELFVNRSGDNWLQRIPDPNDPTLVVSWTYQSGPGNALLRVRRVQSRGDVFNGQVLTGENPSNGSPVRVIVWDTDSASPTYYLGPYGMVPEFTQSDKVRTVDQATAAATGRLNRSKGLTEQVEFTITPNPAIEPNDAVKVIRPQSGFPASGAGSGALVVDSFRMPLGSGGGAMVCRCRQRRVG